MKNWMPVAKAFVKSLLILIAIFLFLGFLAFLFLLSSALKPIPPDPYGIWHSDNPNLTLFVDPNLDLSKNYYLAIYKEAGIEKSVFLTIDMSKGGAMTVQDIIAQKDAGVWDDMQYRCFSGNISLKNGKLIYELKPAWQKKTGYKKIIFEKIGDYEIPIESVASE